MLDIRQSNEYAQFMRSIGWEVRSIGDANAFIRHFPLIGSFIKIQRVATILSISQIDALIKNERAFKIIIEPCSDSDTSDLINYDFKPTTPYAPSKTIQIDLTPSLDEIFSSFGKTTRWTIRKSEKNNVVARVGTIEEFIKLKVSRFSPFRFSLEKMVNNLNNSFSPDKVTVLIAYHKSHPELVSGSIPVAGVFLLFHDDIAYYWMAAATKEGKKLAVPSLLVWEALKLAKERGCTVFDFEGVFDERFPKQTSSWKGFTQFKEGFGGRIVYYSKPLGKTLLPFFS